MTQYFNQNPRSGISISHPGRNSNLPRLQVAQGNSRAAQAKPNTSVERRRSTQIAQNGNSPVRKISDNGNRYVQQLVSNAQHADTARKINRNVITSVAPQMPSQEGRRFIQSANKQTQRITSTNTRPGIRTSGSSNSSKNNKRQITAASQQVSARVIRPAAQAQRARANIARPGLERRSDWFGNGGNLIQNPLLPSTGWNNGYSQANPASSTAWAAGSSANSAVIPNSNIAYTSGSAVPQQPTGLGTFWTNSGVSHIPLNQSPTWNNVPAPSITNTWANGINTNPSIQNPAWNYQPNIPIPQPQQYVPVPTVPTVPTGFPTLTDYIGGPINSFYAPRPPTPNRYRDFANIFNDNDREAEPDDTDEDDDMNDDFNGRSIVAPGKYPHMAAIGFRSASQRRKIIFKCGGSLISAEYVLTAAHCCSLNGQAPNIVKIGDIKLKESEPDIEPQRRRVNKIHVHPYYNESLHYNDIGLIHLNKPVKFTRFVRPIRLWASDLIPYSKVFTMGYGSTSFAQAPTNILTELDMSIVPVDQCNQTMPSDVRAPYGIVQSQMCAKDFERNRDTCQGDSGGPLQLNLERRRRRQRYRYYLVGVTSYGAICRSAYPGVYTRVSSYIDWVASIVWPNYFQNPNAYVNRN